jgi:hypothetical protein
MVVSYMGFILVEYVAQDFIGNLASTQSSFLEFIVMESNKLIKNLVELKWT